MFPILYIKKLFTCKNTSICWAIDSFKSSNGLSFLIKASTYFDNAAGSASHLNHGWNFNVILIVWSTWLRFNPFLVVICRWIYLQWLKTACKPSLESIWIFDEHYSCFSFTLVRFTIRFYKNFITLHQSFWVKSQIYL